MDAGAKVTDFLDVSLNLENESYRPFRKDSRPPVYIQKSSNHPPHISKQLPNMISKRISTISANKDVFNSESAIYNTALRNSGYNENIEYRNPEETRPRKQKTRKRNVMWFNPPWNSAVATNIASKFLKLVDKHFGNHSLFHKYFNRHTKSKLLMHAKHGFNYFEPQQENHQQQ